MLFSCNWLDLEMEIILLGQKHAVKHHSEYFNQHLGGVLLQPTEGFFQPSSICCSGQLTRLSMSPCQYITEVQGFVLILRYLLAPSSVKINIHFVCLPVLCLLASSRQIVPPSPVLRSSRAKDVISYNPDCCCWKEPATVDSSSWKWQGIWKVP